MERRATRAPAVPVLLLLLLLLATPALAAATAAGASQDSNAPLVTGIRWAPRDGPDHAPTLHVTIGVSAPEGLSGGRLDLGSIFHEIRTTLPLAPLPPGSHDVTLSFVPPGDVARPWDVVGVRLEGGDGQVTTDDFCSLANRFETRERPPASSRRLHVHCLGGPGWAVFAFRVDDENASASVWARGVATRDATYAGVGHVLQDATGAVVRWGTALAVAYPQRRDGTYVSVAGRTLVDDPAPDPSAQPGSRRVVVGVGGVSGRLEPGATYRWGVYYATRPGHFDLPFLSLEGSGVTVLSVETGTGASIAWGRDFNPSISVQRSTPDAGMIADGETRRTFQRSATCMFVYLRGGPTSAGLTRIEGPSAPTTGGVVVAGQPGEYRFRAVAGQGASSDDFAVGCADLPLVVQARAARD